ncbi:hypothetical protein MTO96_046771, partial [Rhipicephalus appendiculatus]
SVSGRRSAVTVASNSTRDRARCKIPGHEKNVIVLAIDTHAV